MTQTITKEAQRTLDAIVTPERQRRSEWMTKGGVPRVRTTVQALLNAGDIDQGAADAAERFYRDFVFARNGYAEYLHARDPDDPTRHDEVSWMALRGNVEALLSDIRRSLGLCVYRRVELVVLRNLRTSEIAKTLFPDCDRSGASRMARAQCALALQALADFYAAEKKGKRA